MKNKEITVIALFGKAGSGKDYLIKSLKNKNIERVNYKVSCTTRPKREGEKEGVDYFFLTKEEFLKKEKEGEFVETQEFNGWYYGTRLVDLQERPKVNIGVFNISGICQMEQAGIDVVPIHIQTSDKIRMIRQLEREENPDVAEIVRRFNTDEEDFSTIPFSTFVFYNEQNDSAEMFESGIVRIMANLDKFI